MAYSDDYTEKELRKLERRLKRIYRQAQKDLQEKAKDYFESLKLRYMTEFGKFAEGKYTSAQFEAWVNTQFGRGERWLALRDQMAQRYTDANKLAADYMNGTFPKVYAENYNYSAYEIEKGSGVSFTLLDEHTVKQLSEADRQLLPKAAVDIPKDLQWNKKKLQNALLQGILQGESIDKMADRLQSVANMNRTAAVRSARTMTTGAQNAGRQASYDDAEKMGIELLKEWMSAKDNRVRDSHAQLNGVRVKKDEKFPNGLMYPGDPNGAPAEVYNCRCTLVAVTKNASQATRTDNTVESYKEWLKEKKAAKNSKAPTKISIDAGSIDYMSHRFLPKYGKKEEVQIEGKSVKVYRVDNSDFNMVTDAPEMKSEAVILTEKNLKKIQRSLPEGFDMPQVAIVDLDEHLKGFKDPKISIIGAYDHANGIMYINSKYDTKKKVLDYVKMQEGNFANTTVFAPYLHELGHKYYYDTIKDIASSGGINYNKVKKKIDRRIMAYIDDKCERTLKGKISEYANDGYLSGNYTEIIAECFSVRDSNTLAHEIIQLLGRNE